MSDTVDVRALERKLARRLPADHPALKALHELPDHLDRKAFAGVALTLGGLL
jgi:hypothetical protein